MRALTLLCRTKIARTLPHWLASFLIVLCVSPLAGADNSSDKNDADEPRPQVSFRDATADEDETSSETLEEKSVMKKSAASKSADAPPAAKKPQAKDAVAAQPAPATVSKKKVTPHVTIARKPRAIVGPVVSAATPYRYRYKQPGAEVVVNDSTKPMATEPRKPADTTQRPATIAKTQQAKPLSKPPAEELADKPATPGASKPAKERAPAAGQSPRKIEVASFSGVQPGATTQEELVRQWGNPRESKTVGDHEQLIFAIEPFDDVRVTLSDEKVVESISITLAKKFPSDVVAKQLELNAIEPTPVVDGGGKLLGQSFPERGVTFAFESAGGEPMVAQILLTPIRTAPFLARVNANLDHRHRENLLDLDYVITEEPDNGRAWWLKSRVLLSAGRPYEAIIAVKDAIRLQPDMPEYRLTRARIGGVIGKYEEAIDETKNVVLQASLTPEVKAGGMALLGDLLAGQPQPDFAQALKYHMLAIEVADPLGVHDKVQVRRAAKHVLLDAHLAVAMDVARGEWKNQQTSVPQWIARADLLAKDLIENEDATEEVRLRLLKSALAACAALDGRIDPADWAAEADVVGKKLIAESTEETVRGRLRWQLGTALLDGLKAEHARGQHQRAIALGTQALALLEPTGADAYPIPERDFTVGQTYFRIGAIHAIHLKNHAEAVAWYGKAAPWLEKPLPPSLANQLGPHGETFISMGVSYWSAGQRERAVELTEQGTHLLELAVQDKLLAESSLSVAYNNLSRMHQKLGDRAKSKKFESLAARADATKGARR